MAWSLVHLASSDTVTNSNPFSRKASMIFGSAATVRQRSPPPSCNRTTCPRFSGSGFVACAMTNSTISSGVTLSLPIVGIDLQPNREIAEPLGDLHRRDLLGCGGFRVAEIRRPEKPRRAPRQRLDQPLRRIQLDARHAVGRIAKIGVGEGVIAEIVPFRQDALHEPRIGGAVLPDDEEGRMNALFL